MRSSSRPTRSRSRRRCRWSVVRAASHGCRWSPRRATSGTAFARHWRTPVSSPDSCRLVFLGGIGEVGRNMAALELDDRLLILDVGLSFPSADMPGIDLVLPDMEYVRDRGGDVEAIVLTHGHEDHVGALPYLLRDLGRRVPIYGTAFTLELLKGKLEEHEVTDLVEPRVAVPALADQLVACFLGHSMQNSVRAARELGILRVDEQDVIDIEEVESLDPGRVVIVCTGS